MKQRKGNPSVIKLTQRIDKSSKIHIKRKTWQVENLFSAPHPKDY
jgi:hypothetical protein